MIQELKKVSILCPCYNVEAYLPKCLDTVLGQTYSNLQVVLIDDGSKDGTWSVMQEYAAKDARVEIYHQENQGVAATRNHLLDKIKGDYVLFVDSDDWIELDMVESLMELAIEHSCGFVMCDRVMNDTQPSVAIPKVFELNQDKAIEDFLHHDYFVGSLWNKLVMTSLLHNLRFHCGIWYGEDALFCWSVLQNVDKVVVTSKQLYHYRDVEYSITHQSFGEKKLTGHKTWTILTEDVKGKWPQYYSLVLGTYAKSDVHLLQAAAQSGYPRNEKIKMLQANVRKHYRYLKPLLINDFKSLFYATMIMRWYGFGKVYYRFFQLKKIIQR